MGGMELMIQRVQFPYPHDMGWWKDLLVLYMSFHIYVDVEWKACTCTEEDQGVTGLLGCRWLAGVSSDN